MEALLKDKSAHDSHSYSLYRVLTLMAKPTRRLSWKMKVLVMASIAYRVLTLTATP